MNNQTVVINHSKELAMLRNLITVMQQEIDSLKQQMEYRSFKPFNLPQKDWYGYNPINSYSLAKDNKDE